MVLTDAVHFTSRYLGRFLRYSICNPSYEVTVFHDIIDVGKGYRAIMVIDRDIGR